MIFLVCVTVHPEGSYAFGLAERQAFDRANSSYAWKSTDLFDDIVEEHPALLRLAIALVQRDVHAQGGLRETDVEGLDFDVAANEQARTRQQYHNQRRLRHNQDALRAAMPAGYSGNAVGLQSVDDLRARGVPRGKDTGQHTGEQRYGYGKRQHLSIQRRVSEPRNVPGIDTWQGVQLNKS